MESTAEYALCTLTPALISTAPEASNTRPCRALMLCALEGLWVHSSTVLMRAPRNAVTSRTASRNAVTGRTGTLFPDSHSSLPTAASQSLQASQKYSCRFLRPHPSTSTSFRSFEPGVWYRP
jgi:hypothetical protein